MRVAAGFDGEMRTWVGPASLTPQRHVWRVRGTTPKVDFYARPDAVFDGTGRVGMKSHAVAKELGEDPTETREEHVIAGPRGVRLLLSVV